MKKIDVLQLAIVLIGIIFGFMSIQYLLSSLIVVLPMLVGHDGAGASEGMLSMSLSIFGVVGLQALCCWVMISRSDAIAAFIYERAALGTNFKISSKPNDLLYIVLVALGFYLLLTNLTPMLSAIFNSFKQTNSRGLLESMTYERPTSWTELVLNLVLPLVLLMFGRPIADYFGKVVGDEPILFEETPGPDEITEQNEN
jgi:hypothetical protein